MKFGGQWLPLIFGINERQYSIYDPRRQRALLADSTRWDITEDPADTAGTPDNRGMMEVWPLPSDSANLTGTKEGFVRVTGIRFLTDLVADSDRSISTGI